MRQDAQASVGCCREFPPCQLCAHAGQHTDDCLQGDIVLLALREYQDTKADVIGKYSPDEARELKKRGELPATVRVNDIGGLEDAAADDKEDLGFEFITTEKFVGGEGEEEEEGKADAAAAAAGGGAKSALLANGEIDFDAI